MRKAAHMRKHFEFEVRLELTTLLFGTSRFQKVVIPGPTWSSECFWAACGDVILIQRQFQPVCLQFYIGTFLY